MLFDKEINKEIKEYKKQLIKEKLKRETLLEHTSDWAMLEEFIQQCNDNPGLHIKVTLNNGTILDLVTTKEQKKVNPLFTNAAYEE
jgi:hypothetical protein